jgi:hypothetical protein
MHKPRSSHISEENSQQKHLDGMGDRIVAISQSVQVEWKNSNIDEVVVMVMVMMMVVNSFIQFSASPSQFNSPTQ